MPVMAVPNANAGAAVTLRDVARVAGVHPATVSRALNEETRALVNDDTAQRVLKAAEELGYRPNPIARGLKTNRSYTIGVLIPDLTNPLFPPILRGIEDRLGKAGYTVLIANTDNDPERERTTGRRWGPARSTASSPPPPAATTSLPDEMVEAGSTSCSSTGARTSSISASATADDRLGMRLSVEHLLELGHTRIAHLAGPLDLSTGHDRHDASTRPCGPRGSSRIRSSCSWPRPSRRPRARASADCSTGRRPSFTAIAAANDLLALGCYDVFAERGVRCPEEVSVVGFNDMPFAARFNPPLTTIHIQHYEIGEAAAQLMLEQLQDGDSAPREVRLEPSLIIRESTAPPRPFLTTF